MAKLIGDILVQAKVINPRQLDDAISNQVIYGGRLGTNLMDLEYITESALANFLSVQSGVSTIAPQAYAKIHTSVANYLARSIAERTLTVPLVLKDKTLHVVVANPNDMAGQDEVRFATGFKLEVYVAPEVRIYHLLNKLYGTKREARYVELSRSERMAFKRPEASKAKSAPAPQQTTALSATGIAEADDGGDLMSEAEFSALTESVGLGAGPAQADSSGGEDQLLGDVADDEDEVIVLDDEVAPASDEDEEVLVLTPGDDPSAPAPEAAAAGAARVETEEPPPRKLTLEQATRALQNVENRDQIARVTLGLASATFKRTALFVVRPDMVMGWDGYGGGITRDDVERLMIPLNAPSVFKLVCESKAHFIGAIPKTPVNNRFLKTLGGAPPRSAFVIPIVFKGRVVNILYGDNGPGKDATFDISDLMILGMKIPVSFEDLVRRTKASAQAG